jgi:hypothetical protein
MLLKIRICIAAKLRVIITADDYGKAPPGCFSVHRSMSLAVYAAPQRSFTSSSSIPFAIYSFPTVNTITQAR